MTAVASNPLRVRRIAAVHACRRRLEMDEDAYRALIERVSTTCGRAVRSAADCTDLQLQRILAEFERLGARAPSKRAGKRPANYATLPEYITKIEAQLTSMRLSWAYADAIARRMFGVERVSWCTKPEQLRKILSALAYGQTKRELLADCEQLADRLRIDLDAYVAERQPRWGVSWKRQAKRLETVREHLEDLVALIEPEARSA